MNRSDFLTHAAFALTVAFGIRFRRPRETAIRDIPVSREPTIGTVHVSAESEATAKFRLASLRKHLGSEYVEGYVMPGHKVGHPSHLTMPWYTVVRYHRPRQALRNYTLSQEG